MLAQLPLCIAAIAGGVVFVLGHVRCDQRQVGDEAGERLLWPVVRAIAPVLAIVAVSVVPQMVAVLARSVPQAAAVLPASSFWRDGDFVRRLTETFLLAALFCAICVLLKANGVGRRDGWRLVRRGVTLKMTALIVGVCVLKGLLDTPGTVKPVAVFLGSTGLPVPAVVGVLTFVVGMLLGYTLGFVAICYVMLKPMLMLAGGGLNYPLAAFAFATGFLGVLLSPVHLCLALSREHFDARWGGLYKKLAWPSALVFLMALLMLLWA